MAETPYRRQISLENSVLKYFLLLLLLFLIISFTEVPGYYFAQVCLGAGAVWSFWQVYRIYRSDKKKSGSGIGHISRLKILLFIILGLFLLDTLLFTYTFKLISDETIHTDSPNYYSNVEYLTRSLLFAAQAFTMNLDTNTLDLIAQHTILKGILSFLTFLSTLCTFLLLISLVYSRLEANYRLNRLKVDKNHNHVYIFFDLNEYTRLLSASIKENDRSAIIIFIDTTTIDEDNHDELGSMVDFLTHRRQSFSFVDEIGAYICVANSNLCDVSEDDINGKGISELLGVDRVGKLLESLLVCGPGAQAHFFLLSEDEDRNIRGLLNLAQSPRIKQLREKDNNINTRVEVTVYCHARRNGPNRIIDDLVITDDINVKTIDSSLLAVDLLKKNEKFHPIHTVALSENNPGTVADPFDSLIIGFGEVGSDALRFLYEFGAFIDSSSTYTKVHRSPFRCTAIDNRMSKIAGGFRAAYPGIFAQPHADGNRIDVELLEMDCSDERFFSEVLPPERATKINYIIISTGDSEANITLASTLFSYIRRYRKDLSRLRILIRCTDMEKLSMIKRIADHYNYGFKGFDRNAPVMNIFGTPREIYTYNMIVEDEFVKQGKDYRHNYIMAKKDPNEPEWDQRRAEVRKKIRTLIENPDSPAKSDIDLLRNLRRKESQDMANALHAATKIHVLRSILGKLNRDIFNIDNFAAKENKADNEAPEKRVYDQIKYTRFSDELNSVMHRMAQFEHLRWDASHEAMGYVAEPDPDKWSDERTMSHNCLRPWDALLEQCRLKGEDYILYDYIVIETSILHYWDVKDENNENDTK